MIQGIDTDFTDMEMKLKFYVDKGKVNSQIGVKQEPLTTVKPNVSLIKPLKQVDSHAGCFIAVDC